MNTTAAHHAQGLHEATAGELFDEALIRKYDTAGPRYTSYPTAPVFHEGVNERVYRETLARAADADAPLSIYVHIPFCDTVCYYCGCTKVATKQRQRALPYLDALEREIAMVAGALGARRRVEQLHFGGGTPTFLSADQLARIVGALRERFPFAPDTEGEYGIEVDPRECDAAMVARLRAIGFNRLSLGVQDFDARVQKAVNRIQSVEQTRAVIEAARRVGFVSVNIDLIYGLPHQSVASFDRTLEIVIGLSPDRIALFNYAHLPHMFPPQRRIRAEDLPAPKEKLAILRHSVHRLMDAGYVFIGMDHFAKPGDELARAQREGRLYRNFQGYSTHADCDLVGLGMSSIGQVQDAFFQNLKNLELYQEAVFAGHLPVFRGYVLTDEDKLRRHVIMRLMCDFALSFAEVEARFGIRFAEHFATELRELAEMERDGLLVVNAEGIYVQPRGRLLIRNIAMVFDEHLRRRRTGDVRFSKVI